MGLGCGRVEGASRRWIAVGVSAESRRDSLAQRTRVSGKKGTIENLKLFWSLPNLGWFYRIRPSPYSARGLIVRLIRYLPLLRGLPQKTGRFVQKAGANIFNRM
jgi:hypothetical protein